MSRLALIMLALAATSGSALAFDQQGGQTQQQAPAVVAPGAADTKGLNLQTPDMPKKSGNGTEIRLPGLGVIGTIPKIEFGLDLLYGANEGTKGPDAEKAEPGELTVRGKVRF